MMFKSVNSSHMYILPLMQTEYCAKINKFFFFVKRCFLHCYSVQKIQCEQRSPISKPMTPMCQFFLVNQKHTAQPVTSDSQANDTYESVLFLVNHKFFICQLQQFLI